MEVVPLRMYCKETGEKQDAIERRIQRGIWVEGVHFHKVAHVKERWVDKKAIEKWVRSGGSLCLAE